MWSPRTHDATLNGPVPIGCWLNGTWLRFGYFASRCSGMMQTGLSLSAKTVFTNGAKRCLRWKTTVVSSGVATDLTSSYPTRSFTLLALFIICCQVNLTSLLENGTPSCHLTP